MKSYKSECLVCERIDCHDNNNNVTSLHIYNSYSYGIWTRGCFYCKNKAYFQLFLYKCSQNAIKKNGPGSFKWFLDIIKQKFITLLPVLTWKFFITNSCLPTHFSVSATTFAEHKSHLKIWRGYPSIQFVFLKWRISCYSGTEALNPPKANQNHSAVKHLPLCQGGEHPPWAHHSFQQGSPGTDTSVHLC